MTEDNTREASVRALAEKLLLSGLPPQRAFMVADEFIAIAEMRASPQPQNAEPIDVLNLCARTRTTLRDNGIETIGQLTAMTERQLRGLHDIGETKILYITEALQERGLRLKI